MKTVQRIARLVLVLLLLGPTIVAAGNSRVFNFTQNSGITIDILSENDFAAQFGENADIPRTDDDVIALARELYPPLGVERPDETEETRVESANRFRCGEYEVGLLFAALKNPQISDDTRTAVDHIIAQSKPPLPKTYKSKHFNFRYTDNDADSKNNVTLAHIQATAQFLESYWNKYSTNFTTPKYYLSGNRKVIDIEVYYLLKKSGWTSSFENTITLCSTWVRNDCRRRIVSAHELFHRVQYSYGYISGTAMMRWMTEGTAAWIHKYTNNNIADYMFYMNEGLIKPEKGLIKERALDAAHFWVKLTETAPSGWEIIKDVWTGYKANGHKGKAAVDSAIRSDLGYRFDNFVTLWNNTNFMKDLANSSRTYDYTEDERIVNACGMTFGPLSHVPIAKTAFVVKDADTAIDDSVKPYGTKYFKFELEDDLSCLTIGFDAPKGTFSYSFIGLQNGKWIKIASGTKNHYSYGRISLQGPNRWTTVVAVVGGTRAGGAFKVWADARCIKGNWTGTTSTYCYGEYFRFNQLGTSLTGLMICYDMSWIAPWCRVKGTIDGLKVTLTRFDCSRWRTCEEDCSGNYVGTINSTRDCVSGTYAHENGTVDQWIMVKGAVDPSLIPDECPP